MTSTGAVLVEVRDCVCQSTAVAETGASRYWLSTLRTIAYCGAARISVAISPFRWQGRAPTGLRGVGDADTSREAMGAPEFGFCASSDQIRKVFGFGAAQSPDRGQRPLASITPGTSEHSGRKHSTPR